MRLAMIEALRRVPLPIWLAIVAILVGHDCLAWRFGADDVVFVRNYSFTQANGVAVDWGRVAKDFVGPWGGNDSARYFRPLVSTSLALDFAVFGLRPGWTAAINLIVHWLAAVLVWRVGRSVFPGTAAAAIAALLFVTTPLAHENIAWAVGRCGLTNVFGLAAALALLRAERRGALGLARYAPSLVWMTLDLLTMESALAWTVFPPLCVMLRNGFRQHQTGLLRDFVRDAWPFALLALAYLALRIAVLGSVTGELGTGLSSDLVRNVSALATALLTTLSPMDSSFASDGPMQSIQRLLALAPLLVGLAAPLYFLDPRSRGYRRATAILLGFWIVSRLPGLTALVMGPELAVSRTAYYAYAPLALLTGLLAATSRYGRIFALATAVVFGLGLQHRISERAAWAAVGERARAVVADAAAAHATSSERPFAFINLADGRDAAPAVHVGELPLMLFPPFTEPRAKVVSLYGFAPATEVFAGIWLAHELGGAFTVHEPSTPHEALKTEVVDLVAVLPEARILDAPVLEVDRATGLPALRRPAWALPQQTVVVLSAGNAQLVEALGPVEEPGPAPGEGSDRLGWPPRAFAALARWRRLGRVGAAYAGHLELRSDVKDPRSTTARSRAFFGTFAD